MRTGKSRVNLPSGAEGFGYTRLDNLDDPCGRFPTTMNLTKRHFMTNLFSGDAVVKINAYRRRLLLPTVLLLLASQAGCVSLDALPQSASAVDFETPVEGKTGWSRYQETLTVSELTDDVAYAAAKAGLRSAGFTIKRADVSNSAVIGEHGMTGVDWNVVAGVYFRSGDGTTQFKLVAQGSKDLAFWEDATGSDWVSKIRLGIVDFLESSVNDSLPAEH
ncbi:MAG: hypothetical protein AAFQ16_05870 [Pseudomonadota bacterium]